MDKLNSLPVFGRYLSTSSLFLTCCGEMVEYKTAVLIFSAILMIIVVYFNNYDNVEFNTLHKRERRSSIYRYKGSEAFLINTKRCTIPNYGKKMVYDHVTHTMTSCGPRAVFVRKMYDGWQKTVLVLKIDKVKMKYYVKNILMYDCCYSFVSRSNDTGHEDSRVRYEKCTIFQSGSKADLTHEVMVIKCFTKDILPNHTRPSILYEDSYAFVKKKPINFMKYNEKNWNVLLVGIDTMSRARIMNAMPEVFKYLQAQGWLDYRGYQKIGSNSYPNIAALLTGKTMATMDKACSLGMHKCNNFMAWSTFREAGYITAFGEDNIGLPDTFSKYNGFKLVPTHHYMRPFFLTGESKRGNIICAKHQPSGKHVLDYIFDFANTYIREKFFGAFWINSFAHNTDYLPALFENDTINFLDKFDRTGILDNTFIILISDHGIRYGDSRFSMESYYDERLPMLFIWVPIEFRKIHADKYYNLQLNQNRLVTPYDIYVTLVQITDMSRSSVAITSEACPLCMSIFKEISEFRTCSEAGVNEKWCSCHNMRDANNFMDTDAVNSVQLVVSYIQNYTLNIKTSACMTCHPLRLDSVFRIHSYINQNNKKSYVIGFKMVADDITGKGIPTKLSYEATVLKYNDQLSVLGPIDAISAYSVRGYCTIKSEDQGYCICKALNCYTIK